MGHDRCLLSYCVALTVALESLSITYMTSDCLSAFVVVGHDLKTLCCIHYLDSAAFHLLVCFYECISIVN